MILKISLKPQHKFFFGGESSFNEAGNADSRRATYVLHSRYYPQQTGVLGLIRNQLLLQNGLLWDNSTSVTNKPKAKALIGAHGFQVGFAGNYGVIKGISPVVLEDAEGHTWLTAPLDDVKMVEKDKAPYAMTFKAKGKYFLLDGYREKSGIYAQVRRSDQATQSLEAVFTGLEQVGITKASKPWGNQVSDQDDESGYYYQTFLTFNQKVDYPIRCFSFYVELADEHLTENFRYSWNEKTSAESLAYTLQNALVEFGGERSSFFMQVEPTEHKVLPKPEIHYKDTAIEAGLNAKRLVCLSPCAVDLAQLRTLSQLIVSQTLSFRFFRTKVEETVEYQSLIREAATKSSASPIESHLYELLERGSVIYFDPAQEADIVTLFNREDFKIIGYNQYSIL